MKLAIKNGVENIITASNEDNERLVETMVFNSMCAYANWQRSIDQKRFFFKSGVSEIEKERIRASLQSEYKAIIRCIAMFVDQPTSYVVDYVIARCFEEFGI